jgi:predicted DNA-binding protein YlxM (UPF0122 family)
MENVFEISLLLDFYGQLLTSRQFEILDMHYNSDFSLGEIAEQLNISRQGVFDNIKRGRASLYKLEDKLGLIKKFSNQKEKAKAVFEELTLIDINGLNDAGRERFKRIEEGIRQIIEEI